MIHNTWTTSKPEFTEECLLLTANYFERDSPGHDYALYQILQLDGEDDEGNPAWYWGVVCEDGEEWGDIADLEAGYYLTLPLLKRDKNPERSVATEDAKSTNDDKQKP